MYWNVLCALHDRDGRHRGQLRFAKADTPQAPTRGRVLDHIGFDVKDLPAMISKIEAAGTKLDEPYRKVEGAGVALTYITDPWGTRVELVQFGVK
jgi:predicted enzyme related to lactoylglutathione lyase